MGQAYPKIEGIIWGIPIIVIIVVGGLCWGPSIDGNCNGVGVLKFIDEHNVDP